MDNTALLNLMITIIATGATIIVAVAVAVIVLIITNSRQASRHDAEIVALRAEHNAETHANIQRMDKAQAEWRAENQAFQAEWREENRAYRQAIENRINLDERVRTVEQRTAPSPDDAPAD